MSITFTNCLVLLTVTACCYGQLHPAKVQPQPRNANLPNPATQPNANGQLPQQPAQGGNDQFIPPASNALHPKPASPPPRSAPVDSVPQEANNGQVSQPQVDRTGFQESSEAIPTPGTFPPNPSLISPAPPRQLPKSHSENNLPQPQQPQHAPQAEQPRVRQPPNNRQSGENGVDTSQLQGQSQGPVTQEFQNQPQLPNQPDVRADAQNQPAPASSWNGNQAGVPSSAGGDNNFAKDEPRGQQNQQPSRDQQPDTAVPPYLKAAPGQSGQGQSSQGQFGGQPQANPNAEQQDQPRPRQDNRPQQAQPKSEDRRQMPERATPDAAQNREAPPQSQLSNIPLSPTSHLQILINIWRDNIRRHRLLL